MPLLLLDNFSARELTTVVRWIGTVCRRWKRPRPLLEVSGGVTLNTVRPFARAGVDRISVGRLTHSAPAMDFSVDVEAI